MDATGPGKKFKKEIGAPAEARAPISSYDFFSEHLLVLASHRPPAFSQSA